MKIYNRTSLKTYNTFAVDLFAKRIIEYNTVKELKSLLPLEKEWIHIGKGSNLLFLQNYNGTILHSNIQDLEIIKKSHNTTILKAGAGITWDYLIEWTINHNLYGLENLSYIPGEVGAAAVQNIGAYGVEISDKIESVIAYDIHGNKKVFTKEEMLYDYRKSIIKQKYLKEYIVTHVIFKLENTFSPIIRYSAITEFMEQHKLSIENLNAQNLRDIIIQIRKAKLPEPQDYGNAGSFFMNPIISQNHFKDLQHLYPNIPYYNISSNLFKIPAAWLIEKSRWKGKKIGNVGTYPKQPLVIINYGGASGEEIASFSEKIIKDVYDKFKIKLEPEVRFIS